MPNYDKVEEACVVVRGATAFMKSLLDSGNAEAVYAHLLFLERRYVPESTAKYNPENVHREPIGFRVSEIANLVLGDVAADIIKVLGPMRAILLATEIFEDYDLQAHVDWEKANGKLG